MIKTLPIVLIAAILTAGLGPSHAEMMQENNVIMGPGYKKDQQSQKTLTFAIPKGWVKDEKGAKKLGLYCILVPDGTMLESADRAITIAFQKKDVKTPGLENLKSFARTDLQDTLAQFPNAQFERWQPSKLNPNKIDFFSLEMYGKEKNKPSPQRFLILDSGDGYFSISLTVGTRNELQLPIYDEFFNSLDLAPAS